MELTSYDLSRKWFDWCFENPELISPNHSAIYFFAIEHCNRLGWKDKFGFPTQMAMDAIGIKKHGTYIKYFEDLCEWGFFKLVQKSKNQYSSNIISLVSALPKNGKALDKAIIKHAAKQTESNGQSNSSILKQETNKQETIRDAAKAATLKRISDFKESLYPYTKAKGGLYDNDLVKNFFNYWSELNKSQTKMLWELKPTFEISKRIATWAKNEDKFSKNGKTEKADDHVH